MYINNIYAFFHKIDVKKTIKIIKTVSQRHNDNVTDTAN